MRRTIRASFLGVVAAFALAGVAAAQPISEPASCSGYLASYANPNNAFIVQTIVRPTAEELGVTAGAITSGFAQTHGGSLEACIP